MLIVGYEFFEIIVDSREREWVLKHCCDCACFGCIADEIRWAEIDHCKLLHLTEDLSRNVHKRGHLPHGLLMFSDSIQLVNVLFDLPVFAAKLLHC